MKYLDLEQGTDEWFAARRGMPTGSKAKMIVTPKTGALSSMASKYIAEIIANEIEPDEDHFVGNFWTERGNELEPEARAWYEFVTGNNVTEVGMIHNDEGTAGVSPDGLVDDDGLIEIKCPKASTHVEWFLTGGLPDDHKPQCHMQLSISQRDWLDFISYHPSLNPFIIRIYADDYTEKVGVAVEKFIKMLADARKRLHKEIS
jgi:hypothetical protein